MLYRCFIALEAPDEVRKNLAERLLYLKGNRGVNWVQEQNLHLTLLFLGDVDSVRIPELEQIIDDSTARLKAFPLALRGVELFPAKSPRLIWASQDSQDDSIFALHKDLQKSVRQADFEPDVKPLRLHITMGRIKSALPVTLERDILQSAVEKGIHPYSAVTLYRSVLKPEGPTYHILKQFILP